MPAVPPFFPVEPGQICFGVNDDPLPPVTTRKWTLAAVATHFVGGFIRDPGVHPVQEKSADRWSQGDFEPCTLTRGRMLGELPTDAEPLTECTTLTAGFWTHDADGGLVCLMPNRPDPGDNSTWQAAVGYAWIVTQEAWDTFPADVKLRVKPGDCVWPVGALTPIRNEVFMTSQSIKCGDIF